MPSPSVLEPVAHGSTVPSGFSLLKMPRDGHCGFHATRRFLGAGTVDGLRERAADELSVGDPAGSDRAREGIGVDNAPIENWMSREHLRALAVVNDFDVHIWEVVGGQWSWTTISLENNRLLRLRLH